MKVQPILALRELLEQPRKKRLEQEQTWHVLSAVEALREVTGTPKEGS